METPTGEHNVKAPKDLNFKDNNPGAVQYGNFINYYQFHPPKERIVLLPADVWNAVDSEQELVALDVGCNAGDLTIALYNHLRDITNKPISILGVDIDPTLIERAVEKNTVPEITFHSLDITDKTARETVIKDHIQQFKKQKFDTVFCFSTTMWIHINHGDEGLQNFLQALCEMSNLLIIEPQSWKSYRSAIKRVKNLGEMFPHYHKLTYRSNIEEKIEEIILNTGKVKIKESERTAWGRKLMFFK